MNRSESEHCDLSLFTQKQVAESEVFGCIRSWIF